MLSQEPRFQGAVKLSSEEKNAYAIGADYHFGWFKLEGMVANAESPVGDLNEFFLYTPYGANEKWPLVKTFEETTKQFHGKGRELGLRFCDVLLLAVDEPKEFLRMHINVLEPRKETIAIAEHCYIFLSSQILLRSLVDLELVITQTAPLYRSFFILSL